MSYYEATVKYLSAEQDRERMDEVISFPVETQGFIKWNKGLDAKLFTKDYKLEIHCSEK